MESCGGCDHISLTDGSTKGTSDCPIGAVLEVGGSVSFSSDHSYQGSCWAKASCANGCVEKDLCGLQRNEIGMGGGWQICFV